MPASQSIASIHKEDQIRPPNIFSLWTSHFLIPATQSQAALACTILVMASFWGEEQLAIWTTSSLFFDILKISLALAVIKANFSQNVKAFSSFGGLHKKGSCRLEKNVEKEKKCPKQMQYA